jgi:hypothetical protein
MRSLIGHPEDRAVGVVADQQSAVGGDRQTGWPPLGGTSRTHLLSSGRR